MQIETGISRDLQPSCHYRVLLPAISPLFKVGWSLRDAVNFQSCEMDTIDARKNKQPTVSNGVGASSYEI